MLHLRKPLVRRHVRDVISNLLNSRLQRRGDETVLWQHSLNIELHQ